MDARGQAILRDLDTVARLRAERVGSPPLGALVDAIKRYQQSRFESTYADLLSSPRYGRAARFFLDELYGASDFTQRDKQFARVVPALVRTFPDDVIDTVKVLGRLHALSEELDSDMARQLLQDGETVDPDSYRRAWPRVGRHQDRQLQIQLTIEVGRCLDRYTRNPLLRASLHMMRAPARLAGLAQLQHFLESGFDTFAAMRGAGEFLEVIRTREEIFARDLFGEDK